MLTKVSGADGFERDYFYDSLLRPTRVTTHVPSGPGWAAREFSVGFSYDANLGRMKAMSYPSGEFVRLDYDDLVNQLGYPIGETQITNAGAAGTAYRTVLAMSARGQVASQSLGNLVKESTCYDDSTGIAQRVSAARGAEAQCSTTGSGLIRLTDYTFDQFLNLAKQSKQFYLPNGTGGVTSTLATATESYSYDELQRLLGESRSYQNLAPTGSLGEGYANDDLGNITSKSDFPGAYAYGSGRPHAVTAVGSTIFSYDNNGNQIQMLSGINRTIGYDDQDRPNQITLSSGVTTTFRYSPVGDRYLQRTTTPTGTSKTVYYVDKLYERTDWDQMPAEERTYIGGSVVVEQQDPSPARKVRYVHKDRLGSVDAVTDEAGTEVLVDSHGFDAFGGPRGRDWQSSSNVLHPGGDFGTTTDRGFTGHEHLDDTQLIHMNGRVYDYRLGRFLSVDPIISNPLNSQSLNPYSYIGNNPLSGVDPTGYQCETATGSHICGSLAEDSSSPITVNGSPAAARSHMNTLKEAGQEFLKDWKKGEDNGPKSDKSAPETNSPSALWEPNQQMSQPSPT